MHKKINVFELEFIDRWRRIFLFVHYILLLDSYYEELNVLMVYQFIGENIFYNQIWT